MGCRVEYVRSRRFTWGHNIEKILSVFNVRYIMEHFDGHNVHTKKILD